ncbi:glycosyltransferase family 4 protein [Dysgonomonas sp.]
MKIAIEAQRIFRQTKHGMDIVILETIRELQKYDTINEYYILTAPGSDRCLQETSNFHIIEIKCPSYPLWEQMALPRTLSKIKPDVLHCTSNTAPIFCNIPLIITLHDIIFLEKKQNANKSLYQNFGRLYRKLIVPRILSKSKKIITVSDFERENICKKTNIPPAQVVTIYNGYNKKFHPVQNFQEITRKYIKESNYILFFGNTDPKKNTSRTIKAYALYLEKSKHKRPMLILDMSLSSVEQILKEEKIEHIRPFIHSPGYIENSDLPYIYNGAFVFIYPSLRESFGLPILEAMGCGTPVIVSNTSAIPEIAGDGALYINPYDEQDIANKLLLIETDEQLYQNLVEYGKSRVDLFSWEKTARGLLDEYKSWQ